MNAPMIRRHCSIGEESSQKLMEAMERLNLSARAHDRILKVSRTIADLDESKSIEMAHLVQAIHYRNLDRDFWNF